MLPKRNRVNSELFQYIYENGSRVDGTFLYLRFTIKDTEAPPRFSVVVPKKIIKKAVDRNKVKRRAVRVLEHLIKNVSDGTVGIFFFKEDVINIPSEEIGGEIKDLLQKAGVIRSG